MDFDEQEWKEAMDRAKGAERVCNDLEMVAEKYDSNYQFWGAAMFVAKHIFWHNEEEDFTEVVDRFHRVVRQLLETQTNPFKGLN